MALNSNPILAQAEAAVSKANIAIETGVQQQEDIASQIASTTRVVTGAIREKAVATNVITTQAGIANLQAQNTRIQALDAAGGSKFLTNLMAELGDTTKEMLAAQDEVEEIQNQPVDGVIDYFSQQFSLIGPEEKLNAAQERVANITQGISNITSSQESITRVVATTKQTVNLDTIRADSQLIAATGQQEAAKAELAGLSSNAQAVARGVSANIAQMNARMEAYRLSLTAEGQEFRRKDQEFKEKAQTQQIKEWEAGSVKREKELQRLDLQLEDLKDPTRIAAVQAQREEIVTKHKDNLAFEAAYVAGVQRGQASTGQTADTREVILSLRNRDINAKRKYDKLYTYGSSEDITFGNTPSEAAANLNVTGSTRTEPVMILETLKRGFAQAIASDPTKKAPKPGPEADAAFNSFAEQITSRWKSDIREGDATNPYQAPPMSVLSEYTNIKDMKLYKEILAPMNMKELSPKRIYDAAITGIEAGTISIEEAAMDISSIFTTAAIHNNNTKMFDRIGVPIQESYISEIVGAPVFSETSLGAAGGAGLGVGAIALAGTAPVSVPALIAIGGGAALGAGLDIPGLGAFPFTDSMNRAQVTQALTKLISDKTSLTGGLF